MTTNVRAGPPELYFRRGQGIFFSFVFVFILQLRPTQRTLGSDGEVNHLPPRIFEVQYAEIFFHTCFLLSRILTILPLGLYASYYSVQNVCLSTPYPNYMIKIYTTNFIRADPSGRAV
jgi:hypothetical protein